VATLKGISSALDMESLCAEKGNGSPQGFALRDDGMVFVATLKGTSSALDMGSLRAEKGQWVATGLRPSR